MIDADRLRLALDEAREALDAAAARAGRPPGAVELLLAGKYVAAEDAPALVSAGVGVVGENRLQDLEAKRARAPELVFDFIGHVQRRKARDVLAATRLIHTLDSARLAAALAVRTEGPTRVLVEVNLAGESSKGGILPSQLRPFVEDVSAHPDLVIGGLMAMPPAQRDPEASRPHFAELRRLGERLAGEWAPRHDFADLSMGTSQDYLVAAEEGATIARVGRSLIVAAGGAA